MSFDLDPRKEIHLSELLSFFFIVRKNAKSPWRIIYRVTPAPGSELEGITRKRFSNKCEMIDQGLSLWSFSCPWGQCCGDAPVIKHEKFKREDMISTHFLEQWRSFVLSQPWGNIQDWLTYINGSDKRANINVAECNSIIKNLGLKSFEGKYKALKVKTS